MSGKVVIRTRSEAQTIRLAEALALRLADGDTVLLSGPVGAGKSVLARGVIQSLQRSTGAVEDVPSPTFTLVQRYRAGGRVAVHADLYRLKSRVELDEIGLLDEIGAALCLIEWPDLLPVWVKDESLMISITIEGPTRHLMFLGDDGWMTRLDGLGHGL